ncbi:TlyA family RNA methyltransferase [Haloimpatiens sp. FM7315]|uniref:TlyA family RNA methyltransferase n=1 Tax=Haloimpatiens sp. FM7315 TaxID=3298609 RepID=UPI0035A2B9B6
MCDTKERLDVELVKRELFLSREKARESISKGEIYVNGVCIIKPSKKVGKEDKLEFRGKILPYVSRGGLKLEKAIKEFNIDLKAKVCFDIGASTGGFSDCMLQNDAFKVFAIDVGTGQLHEKIKEDKRVVNLEKTNIRYLNYDKVGEYGDFASIDVSFISLTKVIPSVVALLKEKGEVVALIKPQFEAGKGKIGKHGVVKKQQVHVEVINNICNFLILHKLSILNLSYSPIKGPEGNIEYLIYFTKDELDSKIVLKEKILTTVKNAHNDLR